MTQTRLFAATGGTITTIKQLEKALSDNIDCLVSYQPYLNQIGLDVFFKKGNIAAEKLIREYIENGNINASNNVAMTLLHNLLWAEMYDLAELVVKSQNFTKINYKFSIPSNMGVVYASALDMAMEMWREKERGISLDFIELMLSHGAATPIPGKKFFVTELVTEFHPLIVMDLPDARSSEEVCNLFVLLSRYGFPLDKFEQYFNDRLFLNGGAVEFSEKAGISVEVQKEKITVFMNKLRREAELTIKGKIVVEMTDARKDDGKDTLALPFDKDALNPGCSIM